jgi:hypothetical protein
MAKSDMVALIQKRNNCRRRSMAGGVDGVVITEGGNITSLTTGILTGYGGGMKRAFASHS